MNDQQDLPAGIFSHWLTHTIEALKSNDGLDVPCGDCIGCCSSSYFIHIRPEEKKVLELINKDLLFPAPGLPQGHVVMGFDENSKCPMLVNRKCSIYEHRPITCRTYDCRVFTAAGITKCEDKKIITQRIQRWKFSFPTESDKTQHTAIKIARLFLLDNIKSFPKGSIPGNSTQLAILAIKIHELFLENSEKGDETECTFPDIEVVKAAMKKITEND